MQYEEFMKRVEAIADKQDFGGFNFLISSAELAIRKNKMVDSVASKIIYRVLFSEILSKPDYHNLLNEELSFYEVEE